MGNSSQGIRILIADDHPIFRAGLRLLLESEPKFRVVGEAGDGKEAVKLTRELKPDVLLLDLCMPHQPGLEVLRSIQGLSFQVRTLILATTVDKPQILEALRCGASGILLKESSTQLLGKSIHSIMAGEYWIGRLSISDLIRELKEHPVAPPNRYIPPKSWGLTPRELQIVNAIVGGDANKDIAQKLKISEQTVKHHLTNIFDKLGVSNRLELALFSVHHRLTTSD